MFEFLKAAYNRVIWVLAMEISDALITNSTGVTLWCIYNTVIYHKELKWPKLKISNRTKPTQISVSVSQKEPNTGLYHKDFGFKLTILIACNFKLLWQLYKSQEVLRMTNSFAFTLCYFTVDIRDIHIECSKQFKWNLYFYCLGRASPAVRCPLWSKTQLEMFLCLKKLKKNQIIIYFINTSKCAKKYVISYDVYDGFIGEKILKLWRQESWPFGPNPAQISIAVP